LHALLQRRAVAFRDRLLFTRRLRGVDDMIESQCLRNRGKILVPFWDGCALIAAGEYELGDATLAIGAKGWRDTGPLHLIPLASIMRGRALTALGRFDEARELLEEAIAIIDRTGHRSHEPEVYRALGELHRQRPGSDSIAAERCFLRALDAARAPPARGHGVPAAAWIGLDRGGALLPASARRGARTARQGL